MHYDSLLWNGKFGNGREWKIHSHNSGTGREWKKPIPIIREREGNEKKAFPKFGNGKGMKKSIPIIRERESEAFILGNGREREFLLTPASKSHLRQKVVSLILRKISSCVKKDQSKHGVWHHRSNFVNMTQTAFNQPPGGLIYVAAWVYQI